MTQRIPRRFSLVACLALVAVTGLAVGQGVLPAGVVTYWNCDDDARTAWRDNHWQDGGSPNVAYDPQVKREGRAALRLSGEGDAARELTVYSLGASAVVDPEQPYVLRFLARTAGVTGEVSVRILAHQGEEQGSKPLGWVRLGERRPELVLPPETDWQRFEVPVASFPGGTNRVFFYLGIKGGGTVWFDDLSFALAGVEVPVGGHVALRDEDYAGIRLDDAALPGNLLGNPGFEDGWGPWAKIESAATVARTTVPGGEGSCLELTGVELSGAYAYQQVRVDPRRRYRLSLRASAGGLVGYFFVQVLRFDRHRQPFGWVGADHASEFCLLTGKSAAWVELSQEFALSPDTDAVTVFLRVEDTIGVAWVDEVVLRPLPLGEAGQ